MDKGEFLSAGEDARAYRNLHRKLKAARGVEYLHEQKIVHRAISARNCLVSEGAVKIANLSAARPGPTFQMDTK